MSRSGGDRRYASHRMHLDDDDSGDDRPVRQARPRHDDELPKRGDSKRGFPSDSVKPSDARYDQRERQASRRLSDASTADKEDGYRGFTSKGLKNRETETSYASRGPDPNEENDLNKQLKSTWIQGNGDVEKKGTHTGKAKLDVMQVAVGAQMMNKHKAFMERSPLVISPRTWYMRRWDMVTLVLLLFTAVVTPVEVAFLETSLWSVLFWINRSVDSLFVIDIFLNFFVAIIDPEDGQLIFHHPTIIKTYLKGWFPIDVVSIMPFDLVSLLFENSDVGKLKILRVLRLLRLMKLLRILRAGRIFQRLETQYQIDYAQLELVKFVILALVTSHWMACAFGIVADLEDAEYNWMYYTAFNSYLEDGTLIEGEDPRGVVTDLEIYFAAFYWSSMTMTTIGYGDIVPSTLIERAFVSIMMLVGAFAYGYIIGAVGNVIAQANEKKNKFYALMGELNSFLSEGKLSPALRIRLREYFKYKMASSHVDAHTALLKQMSPALRAEITLSMNTWITKVSFFQKCPEALVIELTLAIKQQTYPPQEKVLVPGDWCDKMYIVRKGVAICRQKIITTGQVFCVECLYKEGKVAYSAHAVTFCDLYSIERDVLLTALKHFPEMRSHFKLLALRRLFFDEVMAYTKAYRTLHDEGINAELTSNMDERPAFYLEKLRIEFGDDGAGMGDEGRRLQRQKTKAATTLQRLFRGHKGRREVNVQAAEAGMYPVFPTQLRQSDPAGYSARAIDVMHHRVGTGLYSLHEKIDKLLGTYQHGMAPMWFVEQGKSGFQFCTKVDADGKPITHTNNPVSGKSTKGGLSLGSVSFGSPAMNAAGATRQRSGSSGSGGALTPLPSRLGSSASSGGGGTSTSDAELRELRIELREAMGLLRGGGMGAVTGQDGGFDTPGPSGSGNGSLNARTAQLQSLVGDLAQQVQTVSRTISGMSDAQRTFQERSQRTILGHLEQAQARIADQVARAVQAAGGDSARASTGTRPRAVAGGGLGITESDPPPGRSMSGGVPEYGRQPSTGDREYGRSPSNSAPQYGRQPSGVDREYGREPEYGRQQSQDYGRQQSQDYGRQQSQDYGRQPPLQRRPLSGGPPSGGSGRY